MLDLVVKTLAAAGLLVLVCMGLAEKGEAQSFVQYYGTDFTTQLIASTMPTTATVLLVEDLGQLWPQPPAYNAAWPQQIYLLQITDHYYRLSLSVWQLEQVRRCLGQ